MPDPLLVLEKLSAGYTDTTGQAVDILRNVTLMVRAGSRVGILGANGAGKSTLVKTLAETLPVRAGERRASRGLSIGYFAQHQLDMLDTDATPLIHLARIAPDTREQELRNYLGGFGFSGDSVTGPVGPMSGGEKARLALALIVWQKPNLLLLDEPSNHLDVETREALAAALAEFAGSMLLVSHDRHLLRTTVDSFWVVTDGAVWEFDGDLEDYQGWLAARHADEKIEITRAASTEIPASADRKQQRRLEAEQRQRIAAGRKPLEIKLAKIDTEMEKVRARLEALNGLITDTDLYSDTRRAERQKVMSEHGEVGKRLNELEEQWLALQEAIEAVEKTAAEFPAS
jgi:ATP-binding cassette subfamily F protein 3